MTIQPVGKSGAALFFTSADLLPYGSTPGGLTPAQTLRLTREALARAGLGLRDVEVEAYPSPQGVLILARAAAQARPPVRACRRGRLRRST